MSISVIPNEVRDLQVTALARVRSLTDRVGAAYLEHYGVIPLERRDDAIVVGSWIERPDIQALDDLRMIFGTGVEVVAVPEVDARAAIRRAYGEDATAQGVIDSLTPAQGIAQRFDPTAIDDLVQMANEAPVVKLVNLLLVEALKARASDVHLESFTSGLKVRYRVDGVLQDAPSPPAQLASHVISRLKIMAELDIAERRLPQDGRIRLRLQDRDVDVRVSTVPTLHGESVVLRLLDANRGRLSLESLGMAADMLRQLKEVLSRPNGIVLVTGPTGSGKTTTLYAAVEMLRTGREKILTVEDPIEYELGVPQMPVNEKVGVTFATALRALLRQDPDVMLVGEIRDGETAEIATQAALTGHLVLSTLHTNDAPSALTRLLDLGVASYLVASTVQAVLAQRLVRTLCGDCAGAGCDACRGSGYRGRVGIYELLVMDDAMRKLLQSSADASALRARMVAAGAATLADDGDRQVRAGITTAAEIRRVIG
jgi:general secretion pathway protein E